MSHTISIKSTPDSLTLVENFIEEICTTYEIGPDVYGNILISLTETVNNAIIHGNKNEESKNVEVSARNEEDIKSVIFTVKDEGNGFDYNNLPDPTAPENLTMIGGRGVFLIKQLADTVIFSNEGSTVELQFKI